MRNINSAQRWLHETTTYFGVLLLTILVSSVILQVISRYILNVAWPWTEELARYSFVWVSFAGALLGLRREEHFTVPIFEKALGLTSVWFSRVASFSALLLIALCSIPVIERTSTTNTPVLEIPMSWVYFPVPLFSLMMAIEIILKILTDSYKSSPNLNIKD
jgi:TRAP-type C4-dicarboxylate transport system permease small subunit